MAALIAVPLDGSRFAESALPVAAKLARSAHAGVRLLLVDQPILITAGAAAPAAERESKEQYLATTAARLESSARISVDHVLVEAEADPAPALRAAVREAGADLVVMAGHARGVAAQPPFPGSTALGVLLQSPVPVLLVRPGNGDAKLPARPGTVLVPVGPTDDPDALVASVADFACLVQAHVTLLRVVPPGPAAAVSPALPRIRALAPAGDPAEVKRAFAQLDGLADALRARGIAVAARVVANRDVAAAILNELAGGSASLVAVRPHAVEGQPGPDIEASVTSRIVRDALKPVLVLPAAVPSHA